MTRMPTDSNPPTSAPPNQVMQNADRSGLILALGILGIVFCPICAPFAWIMGGTDLARMRDGSMNRGGEGVTKFGYVLGIVGCVLAVLSILVTVVAVVVAVLLAANAN